MQKITFIFAALTLLCCASSVAQSVTYYVYGSVYDSNTKTNHYTNIFPVNVGMKDDGAYHLTANGNLAANRLKQSFRSYIYRSTKSSYLAPGGFYHATRTEAQRERDYKMDRDVRGGGRATIATYFSFYFNKDE
jgi:hypothetical protein